MCNFTIFQNLPILAKQNKDEKHYVMIGNTHGITCGKSADFCTLINPSGDTVVPFNSDDCAYSVKTVGVWDIGKWRCLQGFSISMEPQETIIELLPLGN